MDSRLIRFQNLIVGLKWPPDTSAVTRMPSCNRYAKVRAKNTNNPCLSCKAKNIFFCNLTIRPSPAPKAPWRCDPEPGFSRFWTAIENPVALLMKTNTIVPINSATNSLWIEVIEWIYAVHIMHIMHIVHIMRFWWIIQTSPGSPSLQVFVHCQKEWQCPSSSRMIFYCQGDFFPWSKSNDCYYIIMEQSLSRMPFQV